MEPKAALFKNPFRPGAGHMPPYLAGREEPKQEFERLLDQDIILENLVLTGLRGVGKTVLLETFKPLAVSKKWLWVGTDLSESSSISEENIAIRLLTDLAVVTSSLTVHTQERQKIGFAGATEKQELKLNYESLLEIYRSTPGLVADKIKRILETVWYFLERENRRGLIFAYDEAQNLADHSAKEQFPLSMLLDVFQSIQRKNIPFMLVLTGLPTLFPKLVEARTFAERMFHVVFLKSLRPGECKEAILKPIQVAGCEVVFNDRSINTISDISGGYPYFIQFICREVYDVFIQQDNSGQPMLVPVNEIIRKLDTDFFAGRWSRATDRQRELMGLIARLPNCDSEFTVQEVVELSNHHLEKPFGNSQVNQMLAILAHNGLVYKNRYGKYSFAVPLLGQFIRRQLDEAG